ncbi:hypothetical protein AB4114_10990 [Paenibacillus sp. 2RAB27]|uniref:hypothetical protein n=1 Tax=Paenibacillus sp. 2RAB27 TaxID=3232991 RepID=UPI003F9DB921
MYKLTERVGEIELTYEHETLQGVVDLKNAINPQQITVNQNPEDFKKWLTTTQWDFLKTTCGTT